ncbi:MAG: flavodoxin family protein, partial [Campylobacter sp.]|nr:flavodoxin family protein [Campylobacter sp.]
MSKILLVNGSPNKNGSTNLALSEIAKELENNGVQSEILYLGKKAINDCIACFSCTKTGRCAIKDDSVNDIIQRLDEFDGIVAGSPVYYAGPTARIQAFLTRLFFVGGNKFSGKIGASVLIARRGGASASFDR